TDFKGLERRVPQQIGGSAQSGGKDTAKIGAQHGLAVQKVEEHVTADPQQPYSTFGNRASRTRAAIDDRNFAEQVARAKDVQHQRLAALIDRADTDMPLAAYNHVYRIRCIALGEDLHPVARLDHASLPLDPIEVGDIHSLEG